MKEYDLEFRLNLRVVTSTEDEALSIIDEELDRIEQEKNKNSRIAEIMITGGDSETEEFMRRLQNR